MSNSPTIATDVRSADASRSVLARSPHPAAAAARSRPAKSPPSVAALRPATLWGLTRVPRSQTRH
eukprot:1043067-Prymnesium_polylepis.1